MYMVQAKYVHRTTHVCMYGQVEQRSVIFSGQILVVPGFKNSVQYLSSANILLRSCVPSSDASEPALSTSTVYLYC